MGRTPTTALPRKWTSKRSLSKEAAVRFSAWGKWRESRRQYALDRALHKTGDREARQARDEKHRLPGGPA